MSVPSAQRSGSPRGSLADQGTSRPDPASLPEPAFESSPAARPPTAAICPYLLASTGAWRSAAPHRDHRCGAVDPAATLSRETQRQLCLDEAHLTCQAYLAARASRAATLAPGLDPAVVAAADAARRPIARTAPVVLEQSRLVLSGARWPLGRALPQAALVGLMILAFVVLVVARLSAGGPGPLSTVEPSASSSPAPSPSPNRSQTPRPSASASASASPSADASDGTASAAPSFRTYRVQRGDTLVGIASEFGTTVAALRELNGIEGSALQVGQILRIPPPAP